ncbi:hypothetical protein [Cyanobium sp. CH-040]|uniref:hypothetical protein n=1 Tax=Cyanobium sp. CH-040 TaxID=2823708 RepID=UPI0020CBDDEF|nr:hypothetical protein [Cyanobium sp. CH-040]MCP9926397.1 hypothetical protein [Cyanobium sp. CH-040]
MAELSLLIASQRVAIPSRRSDIIEWSKKPKEVQTMPSDTSTIDLTTLRVVQDSLVTAVRERSSRWQTESTTAAAEGKLIHALVLEHWADAAAVIAGIISSECSSLCSETLTARFGAIEPVLLEGLVIQEERASPEKVSTVLPVT